MGMHYLDGNGGGHGYNRYGHAPSYALVVIIRIHDFYYVGGDDGRSVKCILPPARPRNMLLGAVNCLSSLQVFGVVHSFRLILNGFLLNQCG